MIGVADRVVRQGFQRGADRGQPRLVAGEQVPVGCRIRRIGPAGTHHEQPLTGSGRGGPRSGDAVFAVHDEVDGDLAPRRVGVAHRVGAHGGPLLGRQHVETVQRQRLGQRAHIELVVGEHQLDVRIGVVVRRERVETLAAEHDPHHVRRELLGAHDLEGVHRTSCHLSAFPCEPILRHRLPRPDYTSGVAHTGCHHGRPHRRTSFHSPSSCTTSPRISSMVSAQTTSAIGRPAATAISPIERAPRRGRAS